MREFRTATKVFDVEWAAPVEITENIVFLARIVGSTPDEVHNTFKDETETEHMEKYYDGTLVEEYNGYTRYCGFSIENDGSITVTLKRRSNE